MKRILAILAMVATVLCAFAGEPSFTVENGVLTAVELNGATSITIPSGVTRIGTVLNGCSTLKSVCIPEGVRYIDCAFCSCDALVSVNIPDSVEYIDYALRDCNVALYDRSTVPGVWMVDGWVVQADSAANGVVTLKGARGISEEGLYEGLNITKLIIPKTVLYICSSPFWSCSKLSEFQVEAGNPSFKTVGGALYSLSGKTFVACPPAATKLDIADGVTKIEDAAFDSCIRLVSVTIPASVTEIGEEAFLECGLLQSVTMKGDAPQKIGECAFSGLVEGQCVVRIPKGNNTYNVSDGRWQGLPVEYYTLYTVTFDVNGGSEVAARTFEKDAQLGALPTTTRTGYAFAGWYTAKSDGSKISALTKVTKDVTYYAHWTPNKYTVTFDGNGATSGSMKAQARTYDDKKALPANAFKRTNYHFKGWATTKGGSVKYADKQVANLSSKAGATVTLYAVWGLSTYKVKFDGNGATSGKMAAQSINVGAKKALTANAFKRTGYTFQGWAKKKDATKADYKDKASVTNLATKDGATVTLYAVWKANAYTVKFNANGGTGKMANLAMTYGKAKALPANAFKRTNFTFLGWSTSKTATKATYANKASVKNLKASGTVTLYAVWKRNAYSIKFNANGGAGTMKAQTANTAASVALSANAFKRAGFEFLGWATSANNAKQGKVAYANKQKVKDLAKANKSVTLHAVWSLPVWAKGEFNGWCGYWSPSKEDWFDGICTMTISTLGKLSGTLTLKKAGGGTTKVGFSAKAFSKYYANCSIDQLIDLLDYDEEDDPYDIVSDIEDGIAPSKVSAYVYRGVSFKMPGDTSSRKADLVVFSWPYDGKNLQGCVALQLVLPRIELEMHQDVFKSKHVTLPQFSGTPKKSFTVAMAAEDSETWEEIAEAQTLTDVEVTFGANGKLTVVGYRGTAKKWTTTATLQFFGYDGTEFDAGADFLTPDGFSLWFDCALKPGKNGKITASGITFFW